MWICPKCETKNQCEQCVVCGSSRPDDAQNQTDNANKERKSGSIVPVLAAVIICLAVCLAGIAGYVIDRSTDNNKEDEINISITYDKETDPTNKNTQSKKENNITSIESRQPVSDIEGKVEEIRSWYYATQENIDSLETVEENGVVKYYDASSNLVRMDVSADEYNSYTRYYYFKDGELYFAFVFEGTKENRLYFNDELLFRWIDESGVIHDEDFDNADFMSWERKITKEAARLK